MHYGLDGILAAGCSGCIAVVGCAERLSVHLRAVTVEVIIHVVILFAQNAPRAIDPIRCLDGNQSAIQCVSLALCKCTHNHCQQQSRHDKETFRHIR